MVTAVAELDDLAFLPVSVILVLFQGHNSVENEALQVVFLGEFPSE